MPDAFTAFTTYSIKMDLINDQNNLAGEHINSYFVNVKYIDTPPEFKGFANNSYFGKLRMRVKESRKVMLPQKFSLETFQTLYIEAYATKTKEPLNFLKVNYNDLIFSPTVRRQKGNYELTVTLTDQNNLYSVYQFALEVLPALNRGPPQFFPPLPEDSFVMALNKTYTFRVPKFLDIDPDPDDDIPLIKLKASNALQGYYNFDRENNLVSFILPLTGFAPLDEKLPLKFTLNDRVPDGECQRSYKMFVEVYDPFLKSFNYSLSEEEEEIAKRRRNQTSPKCQKAQAFRAKIVRVNQYGLIVLKFNQPAQPIGNLSAIDKKVFDISVKPAFSEVKYIRNIEIKQWQAERMTEKELRLRVQFAQIADISRLENMDQISILLINGKILKSKETGEFICFPEGGQAWKKEIPKQVLSNDIEFLKGTSYFANAVKISVPTNILIATFIGSSLMSVWSLINVSQMMMLIPLMNINLPSNSYTVFENLQALIAFEVIETNDMPFYNQIFSFRESPIQPVVNHRFDLFGYEYPSLFENMGTSLIWTILSLAYQILLFGPLFLLKSFTKWKFPQRLYENNYFSVSIRILLEGALELSVGGIINIVWWDLKSSKTEVISSLTSVIILTLIALMLFVGFYINKQIVKNTNLTQKYVSLSSIFEGCNQKTIHQLNFHLYTGSRKLILVLSLLFLTDYPHFQVALNLISTLWFLLYLIVSKPIEDIGVYRVELFNESMLVLQATCLFAFLETYSSQPQHLVGWCQVGLTLLIVLVNTLYSLHSQIMPIIQSIKNKCSQKKKPIDKVRKYVTLPDIEQATSPMSLEVVDLTAVESNNKSFQNYEESKDIQKQKKKKKVKKVKDKIPAPIPKKVKTLKQK